MGYIIGHCMIFAFCLGGLVGWIGRTIVYKMDKREKNEINIQNVRNALSAGVECVAEEAEKIEKIRTEIEQVEINGYIRDVECFRAGINTALNIIDKYTK